MTTDSDRLTTVLRRYVEDPLDDGDALLLVDDGVCLEIEGLADGWDDVVRRNLSRTLKQTAQRVVVAIARPRGELQPGDFALWRDLHADLGDDVELLPVRALPAA